MTKLLYLKPSPQLQRIAMHISLSKNCTQNSKERLKVKPKCSCKTANLSNIFAKGWNPLTIDFIDGCTYRVKPEVDSECTWCNWNPNHRPDIVWGIDWRRLWLTVRTLPFGAVEQVKQVCTQRDNEARPEFLSVFEFGFTTGHVYRTFCVLKVLYYCSCFNQANGGS